jgi:tetratricopeptide (TPR) repeat protein
VQYVQAAERTGKADGARAVIAKAVADNAAKPEFLMSAVEAYNILHDAAAAKGVAQKVADIQATGPAGRLAVAKALVLLDRVPEAEKILADDLKKTPNDARLHFQMGQICAGAGRTLAAIDQFRTASELDKNNAAYKVALARMLLDSGDVAQAAAVVGAVDASNASANLLRLQIRAIEGQPVDDQMLQQATGGERAGLAMAYLSSGQLPKCVKLCKAELQKTPDDADLRLILARAYIAMGQQEEGLKEWEQVLKIAPGRLSNYLELATILGQKKDPDQVTQQMIKIPGAQEDLVNLAVGQLLVNAGADEKATAVLERLAERPEANEYIRGRARILLAQSLASSNKIDQAIAQCDKLSAIADWRKPALLAKAQILG